MRALAISALLIVSTFALPSSNPSSAALAAAMLVTRAVDPVGTFDYSTVFQEQDATGTITVTSSDGKYGGQITMSLVEQPMPISAVKVEENRVTIESEAPDGSVQTVLQFAGNDFTGEWHYAGMTGALKGKRRAT